MSQTNKYFVCIDPFSAHLSSVPFSQEFVSSIGYFTVDVKRVQDFIIKCKQEGCPEFYDIDSDIRRILNITDGQTLRLFSVLVANDVIYPLSDIELSDFVTPIKPIEYSIDYMYQGSLVNKYYNIWSNLRRNSIKSAPLWRDYVDKRTSIFDEVGKNAVDKYFESSLLFHCCISEESDNNIQTAFCDLKFFLFGTPKYLPSSKKTYLELYREYVEKT